MTAGSAPELGYLETYGIHRSMFYGVSRAGWTSIGLQLAPTRFIRYRSGGLGGPKIEFSGACAERNRRHLCVFGVSTYIEQSLFIPTATGVSS